MKKNLATILGLFMAIPAFAQWTTDASQNIIQSNNVNVGIGSNNPSTGKLVIKSDNDQLTLDASGGHAQFNAYDNVDFRIIQRSNGPMTLWTNTMERMRIDQNGQVGIGTSTPLGKLHISGGNLVTDHTNWYASRNSNGVVAPLMGINGNAVYIGDLFGNLNENFILRTSGNDRLVISANGNVSIGQNNAMGYRLAVAGNMIAESVTVKMRDQWPDFVFTKQHRLPALTKLKAFIDQNGHLPNIPTARQVEEKGIDLGEMNRLLLQKVEELTLYLVQKDKQLQIQQNDLIQLKSEMRTIKGIIKNAYKLEKKK